MGPDDLVHDGPGKRVFVRTPTALWDVGPTVKPPIDGAQIEEKISTAEVVVEEEESGLPPFLPVGDCFSPADYHYESDGDGDGAAGAAASGFFPSSGGGAEPLTHFRPPPADPYEKYDQDDAFLDSEVDDLQEEGHLRIYVEELPELWERHEPDLLCCRVVPHRASIVSWLSRPIDMSEHGRWSG
jgi:hypothetical protein